jgi:hypothetical protein
MVIEADRPVYRSRVSPGYHERECLELRNYRKPRAAGKIQFGIARSDTSDARAMSNGRELTLPARS